MRISRGKEWKFNMGNYEHLQVSAMITVDILDLYTPEEVEDLSPEEQMAALREFAEQHLEQQLKPEITEAAKLSLAKDSILPAPPPPEPEPRRERVTRRRSNS